MDRAPAGVGYGEAVEFLRAVVQGGSGLGFYVSLAPSLFFFLCLSVSFLSVSLSLFLSLILSVSLPPALSLSACISAFICLSILFLSSSFCLSIVSPSISLCIYLPVCQSPIALLSPSLSPFLSFQRFHLSPFLSLCLLVYLSFHKVFSFSHLSVFLKVGGSLDIKYHLRFKRHWFVYRLAFF